MTSDSKHFLVATGNKTVYVVDRNDPDKMTKEQKVIYAQLAKQDTDGDGVVDFGDDCPTEGKVGKVNHRGCPTDGDKDGIKDEKDREAKTGKHAVVDTEGKTIKPADPASAEEYNKSLDTRLETSKEEQIEGVYKEIEHQEWPGLFIKPKLIDLNDKKIQKDWNEKHNDLAPDKK